MPITSVSVSRGKQWHFSFVSARDATMQWVEVLESTEVAKVWTICACLCYSCQSLSKNGSAFRSWQVRFPAEITPALFSGRQFFKMFQTAPPSSQFAEKQLRCVRLALAYLVSWHLIKKEKLHQLCAAVRRPEPPYLKVQCVRFGRLVVRFWSPHPSLSSHSQACQWTMLA